jgi:hypothetical protein
LTEESKKPKEVVKGETGGIEQENGVSQPVIFFRN